MTTFVGRAWRQRFVAAILILVACGQLPAIAGERPPDSALKYYVTRALWDDERVDESQITVDVERGIVKLTGEVNTLAARNFAELQAKKINGVLGVINELYVAPTWRLDSDIAEAIERRISSSANIESQDISVTVTDGKALLHGSVASFSEREQAGVLAAETAGVTEVDNRLSWEWKANRDDESIRQDIDAAYERDVFLRDRGIRVSVADGNVTLTGSVGNALEKDRAGQAARDVANVKNVDNKVRVVWWQERGERNETAHRTDAQLNQAVLDELWQDARIRPDNIDVKASMGHVILGGSVDSHYQRRIAEQDVKDVIGVGWVTNNLFAEVDQRPDRLIQDDVKFNLNTDFTLEDSDIDAIVADGVVTLSGTVQNTYEKKHAGELASDVKGVRKIINDISVNYLSPRSDEELAKVVAKRLSWNWTTWPVHDDITVTVKNGEAKLTGDVNTWAERNAAATASRIQCHTRL